MLIKNTQDRYGLVSKLFHWIMALMVIGMLCFGLYMTSMPNSLEKLSLYGYHKSTGISVLMLVTLRLFWRLSNVTPLPATMPDWQKISAHAVHIALYIFMFAMPITGWTMSSAAGVTVSFFGLFLLPNFVSPNETLFEVFEFIHGTLAYILIATISVHFLAALKHHFINKDDTLRRMIK